MSRTIFLFASRLSQLSRLLLLRLVTCGTELKPQGTDRRHCGLTGQASSSAAQCAACPHTLRGLLCGFGRLACQALPWIAQGTPSLSSTFFLTVTSAMTPPLGSLPWRSKATSLPSALLQRKEGPLSAEHVPSSRGLTRQLREQSTLALQPAHFKTLATTAMKQIGLS